MSGGAGGIPGVGRAEKWISLETYRSSGRGVRTPVCFVVSEAGAAYFLTRSLTGKARRLAANPAAAVAACTLRGAVKGEWARGGRAVPVSGAEADAAVRLRRKKYGLLDVLARMATRSKGDIAVYRLTFPAGAEGAGGGMPPGGGGGGAPPPQQPAGAPPSPPPSQAASAAGA